MHVKNGNVGRLMIRCLWEEKVEEGGEGEQEERKRGKKGGDGCDCETAP